MQYKFEVHFVTLSIYTGVSGLDWAHGSTEVLEKKLYKFDSGKHYHYICIYLFNKSCHKVLSELEVGVYFLNFSGLHVLGTLFLIKHLQFSKVVSEIRFYFSWSITLIERKITFLPENKIYIFFSMIKSQICLYSSIYNQ